MSERDLSRRNWLRLAVLGLAASGAALTGGDALAQRYRYEEDDDEDDRPRRRRRRDERGWNDEWPYHRNDHGRRWRDRGYYDRPYGQRWRDRDDD